MTQANFAIYALDGEFFERYEVIIPEAFQAPVQSFQIVAVATFNSAVAHFTSGEGVISYRANQELCVQGETLLCSGNTAGSGFTGESSNATHGQMSNCCGSSLSQSIFT